MAKIPVDIGPTYETLKGTGVIARQVADRGNETVKGYADLLDNAVEKLLTIQSGIPSKNMDVQSADVQKPSIENVVRLSTYPGRAINNNTSGQNTPGTNKQETDEQEGYTGPKM